jgi:hypothetical protein
VDTHVEHAVGTPPQAHGVATAGITMRSALPAQFLQTRAPTPPPFLPIT